MNKIMDAAVEVKPEESEGPVPLSLAWTTAPGSLPWETSVVDGLGGIVATCPRFDLAHYIKETGNHFGDCREGLVEARAVLLLVLERQASLKDVVDMVSELERLICVSGGRY
jgi:hypothetical protein